MFSNNFFLREKPHIHHILQSHKYILITNLITDKIIFSVDIIPGEAEQGNKMFGEKIFVKITEGVPDCCLTPIQKLLSYIMARTS